jgi:transporter family protein
MKEWLPASMCVFVLWGIWGFLPKLSTRYLSPKSVIIYEVLGSITVGFVILAMLKFRPQFDATGAALGFITGVVGFTGGLAFLYAVSKGPVSVVAAVTALSPALVVVLAHFFLGEMMTVKQTVGCVLALVSIVLLVT